jgi:hypothetical protein
MFSKACLQIMRPTKIRMAPVASIETTEKSIGASPARQKTT